MGRFRSIPLFAFLFPALIMSTQWAAAQTPPNYLYGTGSPTFTTAEPVESGLINSGNGNLHIEIPMGSFPQRGNRNLSGRLIYDSRIWTMAGGTWQPSNVPGSQSGGWRFATSVDPGVIQWTRTIDWTICPNRQPVFFYQDWTWTAPDGTVRHFQITITYFSCSGGGTHSGDAFADDSSGFHMYLSNCTAPPNSCTVQVNAPDGTQLYPNVKDANGNFFSADVNGNIIDTLGRTPVLKTVSGSQTFYDILNSQNTRSRYTVTWATIPVHTAFGQTGIPDCGDSSSCTITVATRLDLPDGSFYAFNYDQGTTAGNYGEMISMQVPTGATINYGYTTFQDAYGNKNRWVSSRTKGSGMWT